MTGIAGRPPALRPRLPRPTARLHLTVLYGTLFTLAGAGLLGFTYWLFDGATAGKRILPTAAAVPGESTPQQACVRVVHQKDSWTCLQQLRAMQLARKFDLQALLTRSDGRVVLSVANTGPAVPPADVDRLYQPFERGAARTGNGDDHTGHGLGLSIVAAIADAHGAVLTTRAQPHGGLHIQVSFPATGRPWHQPHGLTAPETVSTAR